MPELSRLPAIADALRNARTIAVLGAHDDPTRAACYVPEYLASQGYHILPVNPMLAGKVLWGEPVRPTLAELKGPVDIVDVFRRPDQLKAHLADLYAMMPRPRLVWLQLGIREDAFASAVTNAGMDVVQDRCILVDHRALGVGRVG